MTQVKRCELFRPEKVLREAGSAQGVVPEVEGSQAR